MAREVVEEIELVRRQHEDAIEARDFERAVAALHRAQHAVGARLYWHVRVAHQLRHAGVDVNQSLREFPGVRSCIAYALDAWDFSHVFEQQSKISERVVLRKIA